MFEGLIKQWDLLVLRDFYSSKCNRELKKIKLGHFISNLIIHSGFSCTSLHGKGHFYCKGPVGKNVEEPCATYCLESSERIVWIPSQLQDLPWSVKQRTSHTSSFLEQVAHFPTFWGFHRIPRLLQMRFLK